MLAQWQERRTFARLRAQNAGGPRWSFLDGPITANNPMGVHHAWGRDLQGPLPALPRDARRGPALAERLRLPGPVGRGQRRARPRLHDKRDIEAYGIAEFVSLCKQRVLTYAARQTEQSIRLGMWMDWNDPDELRRLRDLLADDPAAVRRSRARTAPSPTPSRCSSGASGCRTSAARYFTFSNENNDLIWGFLAECHRRGWLYKGHDTMPWCARCGTGLSPDGDQRGLPGPRGPGPDGPLPAARPAGRVAARLDDDARGRSPRTSRRRSGRTCATSGSARATTVLAGQGDAQARPRRALRGARGAPRRRPRRLGVRRPVRRPAGRARRVRGGHARRRRTRRTSIGSSPGTRSARTRAPGSSTSPRAAAPRTSSSASRSGCR